MGATRRGPKRAVRGAIERLPSGSLRVRVHAGTDALTGQRIRNSETIPQGPNDEELAERALTRMLNELDEKRAPKTNATVNRMLDQYFEKVSLEESTLVTQKGYARNHIRPLLGDQGVGAVDAEMIESFQVILRKCRKHCNGTMRIEHWTDERHECDKRCKRHTCRPLATRTIRQILSILSCAYKRAVVWKWVAINPLDNAAKPKGVAPNPKAPTATQAAAIVNEAFKDFDWGVLVWIALVTGARRGEIAAIPIDLPRLAESVLPISTSVAQVNSKTWEKPTKTHQERGIVLDDASTLLLQVYVGRQEIAAASVGVTLARDGKLFSPSVDHSTWIKPSTISQRFRRLSKRLGYDFHFHQLRHYSPTELIAAGVDIRTVAGRLGHSGGGATTLKFYTGPVSEAAQRAAKALSAHVPELPVELNVTGTIKKVTPDVDKKYQKIAADLRGAITAGILNVGDKLPSVTALAQRYDVVVSTAHRAIGLLKEEGLAKSGGRGKPVVVTNPAAMSPEDDAVISLDSKRKAN